MIATSNPFDRVFPAPLEGRDLNPLLQDFGLIIHPPMLYMGYVGFAVPFAFAIAAMLGGRLDAAWARWSRPWTNFAWLSLTIGIALIIAIGTVAPVSAEWNKGLEAYKAKDWATAAKEFEEVTKTNPDYAGGYYMLGVSQRAAGQVSPAIASLRKAVELDLGPGPIIPPTADARAVTLIEAGA